MSDDLLKRAKKNIREHEKKYRDRKKALIRQRTEEEREEDGKKAIARLLKHTM